MLRADQDNQRIEDNDFYHFRRKQKGYDFD
jgi:hypothetical protein